MAGKIIAKHVSSEGSTESWLWHLLGLVAPIATLIGNLVGESFAATGVILILFIYPIIDYSLGTTGDKKIRQVHHPQLQILLYCHVIIHTMIVTTLCFRAFLDGNSLTLWMAIASTGVITGVSGIIVGHELGHRKYGSFATWLSRWNLATALYLHFEVEHNRNHHPLVATDQDPASSPAGRGFWSHLVITIPAQFTGAWAIEKNRSHGITRNRVFIFVVFELAIILSLGLVALPVALAFAGQALLGIFLLEYVNYIRHYGLRRNQNEIISEMHAWQTDSRWSRWTLLALTRHPAHHLKPTLHFWQLESYPNAPTLPTGYYALFWPALFPPLWRKIMDNRLPYKCR